MAASLKVLPASLGDNSDVDPKLRPKAVELRREIAAQVRELLRWASEESGSFKTFEEALARRMFLLARLVLTLFLCSREKKVASALPKRIVRKGKRYQRRPEQARNLNTDFGVVRYWRTYCRGPERRDGGKRQGFHPLDVELGLTADRLSMPLMSKAARLSAKLSFAETREVLSWFMPNAPSTEVIEKTVLGLGARTEAWFESTPAPEDDGDVLVIQIDGKAVPTATDSELERRRGKRKPRVHADSPRHRGRAARARYGSKSRRKKGDKSKNGKVANVVVMYTLKRADDGALLGPVNKRVYASFAPKRHAFAYARREADKRGFTQDSGKTVQLVTDGDDDFAYYATEYFPEATHTVDIIHVTERLWAAGQCLYKEGSDELKVWVDEQRARLYEGEQHEIVAELQDHYNRIPLTGPGNKGKRKRLEDAIRYLEKRLDKMNYDDIVAADLEVATGVVEGAVNHVVGLRFDHGGMRWIKERAEALLKLRCIEINSEWDAFIDAVHDQLHAAASAGGSRLRLQTNAPKTLPNLAKAA
jgi:hypothetical protein